MGSGGSSVLLVLEELLKVVPPGLFLGETLGLVGLGGALSGPPFSQRAPLFFRPSDLPSHNDRAISHPDERLLSLTNIHPSLLPGSANIQDKRAAAKQKAGAESAGMESTGMESTGMESTGTESAGAERRRGGNCRNGKCRNGKCRNGKCRNGKCRNEEKA